jgi:hypothetical protein
VEIVVRVTKFYTVRFKGCVIGGTGNTCVQLWREDRMTVTRPKYRWKGSIRMGCGSVGDCSGAGWGLINLGVFSCVCVCVCVCVYVCTYAC